MKIIVILCSVMLSQAPDRQGRKNPQTLRAPDPAGRAGGHWIARSGPRCEASGL